MHKQLTTRIDPKIKSILYRLHKKTQIPIRQLTEKAIILLDKYYKELQKEYEESAVDNNFAELLEYSMKHHDRTYKRLTS